MASRLQRHAPSPLAVAAGGTGSASLPTPPIKPFDASAAVAASYAPPLSAHSNTPPPASPLPVKRTISRFESKDSDHSQHQQDQPSHYSPQQSPGSCAWSLLCRLAVPACTDGSL